MFILSWEKAHISYTPWQSTEEFHLSSRELKFFFLMEIPWMKMERKTEKEKVLKKKKKVTVFLAIFDGPFEESSEHSSSPFFKK